MRRVSVAALACAALLGLVATASAHTGTAVPTCTAFGYDLTEFGPFANTVSYDVQSPQGQLAAGTIGPFGVDTSGTITYSTPFTGTATVQVFFAWTLPDNTRPRAIAGSATVSCPPPPGPPGPPPPAPPGSPPAVTPPPLTPVTQVTQPPKPTTKSTVQRCRGPWATRPPGVRSRRGAGGRWYGYETRRTVTSRSGKVVDVKVSRRWCGTAFAVTG